MIYSISLHCKPGKNVKTFWFTDEDKAYRFFGSVKDDPKVIDASFIEIPVCKADIYNSSTEEEFASATKHYKA